MSFILLNLLKTAFWILLASLLEAIADAFILAFCLINVDIKVLVKNCKEVLLC